MPNQPFARVRACVARTSPFEPAPGHQQTPIALLIFPLLALLLALAPTKSTAHAGSIDQNGGHYYLNSYHCHMNGCEMPDTFSRIGRDSLLMDRRGREKFFNPEDWSYEQDFDNDCQSTRQEMLILTSRSEPRFTNPRNCVVRTGEWLDEYTGKTFTVASKIDLDHVIPLLYAHSHGGDRWPAAKKLQFANDPLNLMLVERREIRRKSNRGPDRYLPRDAFHCEYAKLWTAVASKYSLDLESRDRNRLKQIERECGAD